MHKIPVSISSQSKVKGNNSVVKKRWCIKPSKQY